MKKLFTILLVLISFSTFAQFEAGEYVNSDTLKNKGSSIIYPHADSVEQFYYSKMRDPSEPLDGVNLRTLFDRLASLDTLGLNVSDLVSGTQIINAGETQIFFPSAFDSTNVIVVPFVRRISDDAVIDFIINDIDSLGFDVVVWEDSCKIQYVASQKITHSSDIFKEPIYSADSAYLKLHVRTDFDTDSTNEIQDLSGLVPFLGADRDVDLGANSISTDTVKINGVPLLLNAFKKDSLGGAGNIFYSTGASSQPASGSVNQVVGNNYIQNQNSAVQSANTWINGDHMLGGFGRVSGAFDNIYLSRAWYYDGASKSKLTDAQILGLDANGLTFFANTGLIPDVAYSPTNVFKVSMQGAASFASTIQATTAKLTNLTDGYLPLHQSDANGLVNSNIYQDGIGNVGINKTTPSEALDINGNIISDVLKSRVATGTPPLVVASTTLNANLNADLLDGQHGSYYAKYSDETLGHSVDFNSITYSRGCAIQIQPIHVPNYTGQTNTPFQGYGQLVTFNSIDGLFPFQIACKETNGGLFYRSNYYTPMGSYSFGTPWQSIYSSGNSNISTVDWNAKQYISHVPTGTPPLVVASSTKVDSLNVDLLDGKHQSDFLKYTDPVIESDTIKARADIIVSGEIYDKINHLYGMVYDSTITLSLTQNVWQQVTNATKTLYSTAEQDGITISGDTIVFSKAGGYDVYFEINCTGINSKDYHYKILQKNGTTTVRSYNKYASTGTKVLRNEKAYIHVVAGSKVWCEIMSPSSAPGSITIQGAKVYAMQHYLEK